MTEEVISIGSNQNPANGSNPSIKKKRNLPGNPDPEAEVIALSPKTLMATNRFLCEICGKGFQRDQNLQLHRRGHNLPWKLKQRTSKEIRKRVYICPEKTCIHNHPTRALGDLTGIKKHFCRKHGEKKWKCDKCSKRYAVQSDCKAHAKTCGTREYKCDCGTIFSRRDSFITHRAFCDALAEETARVTAASHNIDYHFIGSSQHFPSIFKPNLNINPIQIQPANLSLFTCQQNGYLQNPIPKNLQEMGTSNSCGSLNNLTYDPHITTNLNWNIGNNKLSSDNNISVPSLFSTQQQINHPNPDMSATALLQKAAQIGSTTTDHSYIQNFGLKGNSINDDHTKLCGLYGSSSANSGLGSDVESSVNDLSAINNLEMYTSKRRRIQNEEINGGETRDFLGVGIQSICHPSSINGWI